MQQWRGPIALLSCNVQPPAGMLGEDESTKFSPWLSMGCLSPRTVYHELKKYEGQRTANKSTCGPAPYSPTHVAHHLYLARHLYLPCTRYTSSQQLAVQCLVAAPILLCGTYSMHA